LERPRLSSKRPQIYKSKASFVNVYTDASDIRIDITIPRLEVTNHRNFRMVRVR